MMANVARGNSTCEYQTVAEFDQQIIDSFKADILAIVGALLEAKVVPESLKDDILQETGFTDYCKASKLRNHVVDGVESCPQTFYMLCDALEGSGQKDVAQILREHCKKLKEGCKITEPVVTEQLSNETREEDEEQKDTLRDADHQKITYAVKFVEEVLKTDLDDDHLSHVEDSLKLMEKLSSSCEDEEDIKCFARHLSDIGIAKVLKELSHSLLKLGFTAKIWPCLYALRVVCLDMSHRFESFCTDLGSTGFVVTFVNELKIFSKPNISQNPAEEFMLASALAILGNAAKDQCVIQVLWDVDIIKVLLTHANSPLQHICISTLTLIGLLSLDVNEGSITIDGNHVSALHSALTDAASSETLDTVVGSFKMTATELLKGINGLAFNRKNAVLLVDSGILPLLTKILSVGSACDKQHVLELLWTLALESNVKEQLRTSSVVQKELVDLSSSEPGSESLSLAVECAILKINGWDPLKDINDTLTYVECAYQQRRYQECVYVCGSIHCSVGTMNYTDENLSRVKLVMGKSLYHIHRNAEKFCAKKKHHPFVDKTQEFAYAERVVRTLGPLIDNGHIDDEGIQYLDLAMVDYIRETNNLKNCQRCLLCHSWKKLQSSHVVPNFILSRFAEGMKKTVSKKDYLIKGLSSEELQKSPRKVAWYMFCKDCELKLSSTGENQFANDFFHKVYQKTDPLSPTKEHGIAYSEWLYQFAIGIIFRGLAINPKGMSGFLNEEEVYKLLIQCRNIILHPDKLPVNHPQIAIFVNPLSPAVVGSVVASTFHRVLNMPSFMYLAENEEKLGHKKIPRVANFFLAHLGMLNIVVSFPGGDFSLPAEFCISAHTGTFTVPEEDQRLEHLPHPIWESLNLVAEELEVQEMKITHHRLQECKVYESRPAVPENEKKLFGLSKAKENDIELVKKMGFQPSSDPRFPKEFNLLPPNIIVQRQNINKGCLKLPENHNLLLHHTLDKEGDHTIGVTFFLCASSDVDEWFEGRLYVVVHRYMPGLHLNVGFFVSTENLFPEEVLPDRNPKYYADVMLDVYQSNSTIQTTFSELFAKAGMTLQDVLQLHLRQAQIVIKCLPKCWFCTDKCDVCFKPATDCILLYGQKRIFCSKSCCAKFVKPASTFDALPNDFKIINEFNGLHQVTVPEGHVIVSHFTTPFNSESRTTGELTVFLCKAGEELENRAYILCHFHSLAEQFSVGIFISTSDLLPMELLPGSNCSERSSNYIDSLYSTSIVQLTLLQVLSKHQQTSIGNLLLQLRSKKYIDKQCQPPCWYCRDRCTNCFNICPGGTDSYCSDSCRDKPTSPPHLFSSLPHNFVVKRSFDKSIPSQVILPSGHRQLFHATGSSSRPDGTIVSEMTIILCIGEGTPPFTMDKPYVIFQDYKLLYNRLANVSFYISPVDLSIQQPVCADDVAGRVFISQLHAKHYNIPEGLQEALKRRGFLNMTSFIRESVRSKRTDIKCSPPCWYCLNLCDICLQPADTQTDVNGELIQHCTKACLDVLLQNPSIIHLLPQGFSVHNRPNIDESEVQLPDKHRAILHVIREYTRKDGRNGQYLLILCINTETGNKVFPAYEPYALYHQFNLLRQITFGFYLKMDSLEPSQPLNCEDHENRLRCLRFMQQVTQLEPISEILRIRLRELNVLEITPNNLASLQDKRCGLPCWYCRKMNIEECK